MSGHRRPRTSAAFLDESQPNRALDPHTYVLAATVCDAAAIVTSREAIAALKLRGQLKLHWHDESAKRRMEITECIAGMSLRHFAVVRDGRPGETSERRRRHCLERMLYELDGFEIATVCFESRGPKDDRRDRDMLDALRARKVISPDLRIDHIPGPREELLWVADAICGAVVRHRSGDSIYLQTIEAAWRSG